MRGWSDGLHPRYQCVSINSPTRRATIKQLTAYQPHGISSPPRFSQSCPHCLRRFVHARTVAGQKYLPTPSYGHTGRCPVLIADVYRSHFAVVLAHLLSWLSVQSAEWEKYLMVLIFSCQCSVRRIAPRRLPLCSCVGFWNNPLTPFPKKYGIVQ